MDWYSSKAFYETAKRGVTRTDTFARTKFTIKMKPFAFRMFSRTATTAPLTMSHLWPPKYYVFLRPQRITWEHQLDCYPACMCPVTLLQCSADRLSEDPKCIFCINFLLRGGRAQVSRPEIWARLEFESSFSSKNHEQGFTQYHFYFCSSHEQLRLPLSVRE